MRQSRRAATPDTRCVMDGATRRRAFPLCHGTTTRFLCARFTPNVGAPLVTPGIPPHPRHHGRFTAARFRRAARPLRRGTATRFLCARFAPNVGAPLVTPGIPPHPRHHGRFIAACFRRAARPLRRGTARCVPIAPVHVVPCRAPGVMNGAPTVHCRTFHCAACSFATERRHVSFAPVCTKRRGATPDARNIAAPAPSWTVHRRMSTLIYAVNEEHRRKKIGRTLAGSAGMRKFGATGKFTPEKRHPGRHTQ